MLGSIVLIWLLILELMSLESFYDQMTIAALPSSIIISILSVCLSVYNCNEVHNAKGARVKVKNGSFLGGCFLGNSQRM